MKTLQVALVQQSYHAERAKNIEKLKGHVLQAAQQGAQLVVLSELHQSLYFAQQEDPKLFDLAEPIPGPTTELLSAWAKESHIVLVGSIFERRAAGVYHNTAVVFETDGSIAGQYRKMHIPDDPGYYEKFYFTPGDLGFKPIQTSVGRLGLLICWDQWFPEAARLMALAGADLLIYPTAIGADPQDPTDEQQRQLEAWQISQRAHGVANGLPVLTCNRVGIERSVNQNTEIHFWGHSFIAGPQGELIAEANGTQDEILSAELDLAHSETVQRIWPFKRDRRIDAYAGLLKRMID